MTCICRKDVSDGVSGGRRSACILHLSLATAVSSGQATPSITLLGDSGVFLAFPGLGRYSSVASWREKIETAFPATERALFTPAVPSFAWLSGLGFQQKKKWATHGSSDFRGVADEASKGSGAAARLFGEAAPGEHELDSDSSSCVGSAKKKGRADAGLRTRVCASDGHASWWFFPCSPSLLLCPVSTCFVAFGLDPSSLCPTCRSFASAATNCCGCLPSGAS